VGFLLLALAVVHEAGSMLFYREQPRLSIIGIVLAALSLIAKPLLAGVKRRTAAAPPGTMPAIAAVPTTLSVSRSLILLLGLCASAMLHWRWADPAAALLMLPFIIRQGWKAIEESKEQSAYRARLDRAER
jgi:divalent metal cation (Fe/Co/Zn/Cd) transporter